MNPTLGQDGSPGVKGVVSAFIKDYEGVRKYCCWDFFKEQQEKGWERLSLCYTNWKRFLRRYMYAKGI